MSGTHSSRIASYTFGVFFPEKTLWRMACFVVAVVVVVVLTLTRITKSVVTGQAPVTLTKTPALGVSYITVCFHSGWN